ncbi:MAG: hypothetical protein GXO26_05990 [Crenarchaeota archaeon]|nr:hypothetical protein [Thermoproteota archaeon]
MREKALQLLRKIAERGYIMERELKKDELEIVEILLREGVLERCYTIAPEYRSDIVRLCRPRVLTIRNRELSLREKVVKLGIPISLTAIPFYLFIKSILLGYLSVALFFLAISGLCIYGGLLISRRLVERFRMIRIR